MALSREQIHSLEIDQNLRMMTSFGLGKSYLDAKVLVVTIGMVGCQVLVTEILSIGEDNASFVGQKLICGFEELTVLPE